MDDKTHIRFVDAHAKCIRGHNDGKRSFKPGSLVHHAVAGFHACVVAADLKARGQEASCNQLDVGAGHAVHDAGKTVIAVQQFDQFAGLVPGSANFIVEIGPVESRGIHIRTDEPGQPDDLFADAGRGCCRKCRSHRTLRKALKKSPDFQVGRPEFVAPLRNAVRFIDADKGDRSSCGETEKSRRGEALRGNIKNPDGRSGKWRSGK